MSPRRSSSSQRLSIARNQSPEAPVDVIASLSLNSNPNTLLTPPREGRHSIATIRFGDNNASSNSPSPFTFGQLYNVTPMPSPQPSPEPRPRLDERRSSSFSFSLQLDLSSESHGDVDDHDRTSADRPAPTSTQTSRRQSDVSVVSVEMNTASPYDVNREKVPDEPFFDARFQAALVKGKDLAQKVANALTEGHFESEHESDLKRLWDDAKKLSSFQTSDTRTVAVLGDSGEGDYSLPRPQIRISN